MASLPGTPSHFVKIVLTSALEDKKLRIPPKFVRKFGHELSDVATLIVPNGSRWRVDLKKDGRNVWFCDGWHEFVESHSISSGYFLFFKYGKNSRFYVVIFDLTACEIDYPCSNEGSQKVEQNSKFHDEMDNEECFQISEDFFKMNSSPSWQNRAMPTFCSTQGIKRNLQSTISLEKSKVEHRCEQQSKKNTMEVSVEITESNDGNDYDLWNSLEEMGICITEKYELLSAEERERVIHIARSLKPKNLSFMVIIRPSKKCCREVYVPAKFARKFINKDAKSIKVQVYNGTECSVQVWWRCHGGFFLSKGWPQISEYYNLKVGDICIFETTRTKNILKLTVYALE